ncbi:MAG: homoserine kinase [Bacillota bacterium]
MSDSEKTVRVEVPATTANLGPGFDCMGAALSLFNTFEVRFAREPEVVIHGEYAEGLPSNTDNLVYHTTASVLERLGVRKPLAIRSECNIPPARGLGSSASCVVGGILAANELLGRPLNINDLLGLAAQMEGHPDNVVPAILGGLTFAAMDGEAVLCKRLDLPPGIVFAVAIPDFHLSTKAAREALPSKVPVKDATFNLARAAMMAVCFAQGDLPMLNILCQDRLHQPYRARLIPGLMEMLNGARHHGALACYLSGAGPSVACLVKEEAAAAVGDFMVSVFESHGIRAQRRMLKPYAGGASVLVIQPRQDLVPPLQTRAWTCYHRRCACGMRRKTRGEVA